MLRRRGALPLAAALATLLLCSTASAETAWSRGAPLNLRSGPSTAYRILDSLQPGQRVEVLDRGDGGWSRVRTGDGTEGWVSSAFLDAEAPPVDRVETLEAQLVEIRHELDALRERASRLADENETLSAEDTSHREAVEELTRENMRLRAGERWAEWLTGALILGTGMALGGLLARVSGRRGRNRLKL